MTTTTAQTFDRSRTVQTQDEDELAEHLADDYPYNVPDSWDYKDREELDGWEEIVKHVKELVRQNYGDSQVWRDFIIEVLDEVHKPDGIIVNDLFSRSATLLYRDSKVIVENDRRERVYEATNRILEYARTGDMEKVEQQVDNILSTIGVPDRLVEE